MVFILNNKLHFLKFLKFSFLLLFDLWTQMWPNNDLMDGLWGRMSLGPSFGIFFGKYEECSVRVWGCIQLHSFASPYGKWLNLSVTVLSHFQNTHRKRREKKKQRSWWPPTVTLDLRISPEKFSALSTRPATKPRFAGTLSRHLQQEDNTRDTGG